MNSWKKIKLGDALDYVQPTQYIVTSADYKESNEIPVLTPGKSFILGYTDEKHGVFTDVPTIIFDDFTTAFKYVDFPFKVKSSAMKMLLPSSEEYNIKFLYYLMLTLNFTADEHKRFWISQYSQQEIFIPPLEQQKKIAAILDAADAYRQKTKALIAKYDELTQSLFLDMFGDPVKNEKGWEKRSFESMVKFDTKMTKDFDTYGDLLHVGIGNIQKNTGKIIECLTANEEGLTSGKYLFDKRHIIYSKIRPNLNKVALPDFTGLCSADSYPLLPIEGVSNRIFIANILRSECFLDFILQHSTRTNIPKANRSQMKLFVGICPPFELQNQFSERVKAIEEQKEKAQASLEKAEELFNSLLKRAFKAELV
jgi:type I restriction enzyme S subunit